MKEITSEQEFDEIIRNGVVVVDFFATWCKPCKMIAPLLEEVTNEVSDVTFIKVDIDKLMPLPRRYNVRSVPTIMLFKSGVPISLFAGYVPKQTIIEFINQNK